MYADLLAFSWVRRWNGFVETSLALLAGGGGVETAWGSWLDMAIFLRKGFFVSVSPRPGWGLVSDDAGGLAMEDGGVLVWRGMGGAAGGMGGAGGGAEGAAVSLGSS